jgi:hypothetical protein
MTAIKNSRPATRFNVPPKPTAILDGSLSWKFGMHAPRPTLSPLRPNASTATVRACRPTTSHGMPSMTSPSTIRNSAINRPPVAENTNLPHKSRSRCRGSRPRIQNLRPSRLSMGKMNRPV